MDNTIENIIVISNLLEVTKDIVKNVGYEYQAPLEESVLDEVICSAVLEVIGKDVVSGVKQ